MARSRRSLRDVARARLRGALGIDTLHTRIDQLEERLQLSYEETRELSTRRWRDTAPELGLTWGIELSGQPFMEAVVKHGGSNPGTRVLEVGPGYGRLIRGALEVGMEFEHWTGLDLSPKNVEHLRAEFPDNRYSFQVGDAMDAVVEGTWNLLISSLTLKHIYPSFEPALRNLLQYSSGDAKLMFDVIEGEGRMFESNRVTYIRRYSRPELDDMLDRLGYHKVTFDTVVHAPGYPRLLVVARRQPQPDQERQPIL